MTVIIIILIIILVPICWGTWLLIRSFWAPSAKTRARRYERVMRDKERQKKRDHELYQEIQRRAARRAERAQ